MRVMLDLNSAVTLRTHSCLIFSGMANIGGEYRIVGLM